MSTRTRALLESLAQEWPNIWGPILAKCDADEREATAHRMDLSGFTESERAWFRKPLSAIEVQS